MTILSIVDDLLLGIISEWQAETYLVHIAAEQPAAGVQRWFQRGPQFHHRAEDPGQRKKECENPERCREAKGPPKSENYACPGKEAGLTMNSMPIRASKMRLKPIYRVQDVEFGIPYLVRQLKALTMPLALVYCTGKAVDNSYCVFEPRPLADRQAHLPPEERVSEEEGPCVGWNEITEIYQVIDPRFT